MLNRNNNLHLYTLRQFILNDEPPLDPFQTAEAIKRGFFSSVFYHTVNTFKTIALKSIVLVMTFLSLIEMTHDYFYSVRDKNRNASFWFKHILGSILFAAEVLAITFFVAGTIASAVIAPAIFTAITGTKLLLSLSKALYYGYKVFETAWLQNNDEKYTQQYEVHKRLLKTHLINTFIAGTLFAGVFVGFLAPEVPAIVIPATLALSIKWTACLTLGIASINTLGKKIYQWGKKKLGLPTTDDPVHQPLIQGNEFLLSQKLHLTETVKNKYLENKKLNYLIPSYIDDLLIKMEILHERHQSESGYLFKLIDQEKNRASSESHKWRAIQLLEKLIRGENLHLKFQHVTYDNTVFGIAQYLQDTGFLKSVLHSSLQNTGGMQKLFVLVDHYCKLNPQVLYQNAREMEEKEVTQEKIITLQELVRDLRKENSEIVSEKEKENQALRSKFSSIKFECEYKASHAPKTLQKLGIYRSKSMPNLKNLSSLHKLKA